MEQKLKIKRFFCSICRMTYTTNYCGQYGRGIWGTCSPWCGNIARYLGVAR